MAVGGGGTRLGPVRAAGPAAAGPPDADAVARLFDLHLPRIYAFVARRVEDRAAAEDVTARTFERAFRALAGGEVGSEAVGRFLYRVAATAVVDHARRGRRRIPATARARDFDHADDGTLAEAIAGEAATRAFAASIDRDRLRRAFVGLPDPHRRVIVLKYFDGLAPDEICAALACSREALESSLRLALGALDAALQPGATDAA